MPKYFARAKGDKNIPSPPKVTFNYDVIPVAGYWAAMDICRNANFTTETKVKTQSLFSPYHRLNLVFQGQISQLLRLRKENYRNFNKLKWSETGQHTVSKTYT